MNAALRNPLHIYRALLREAGYLFHPKLQDFHSQHVRWAFRRKLSPRRNPGHGEFNTPDLESLTQQLRRARQYLYTLQRANQGYVGSLENVLKMAYARKGKRRRQLLKEIMVPESAKSNDASVSTPLTGVVPLPGDLKLPESFGIFLRKQKIVHKHLNTGGTILSMPKIPEKNKSGKPFPKSRARNMMKAWYARSADLLSPPLSQEEWMEVYKIGTDRSSNSGILNPQRRRRATVDVFATTNDVGRTELDQMDNLVNKNRKFPKPKYSYRVREIIGNPHNLTHRYLRRLVLRTVVNNTPTAITDDQTGKLAPRWDATGVKYNAPVKATESQVLSMFD